jgi:hypothetical protein
MTDIPFLTWHAITSGQDCFVAELPGDARISNWPAIVFAQANTFCMKTICIGLARTIYIRFKYGIFGREITKYTVIYGVYLGFWPTLHMHGFG